MNSRQNLTRIRLPVSGVMLAVGITLTAGVMTAAGCGSTKTQLATEQLLMSDAVDRAVATIDFQPLAGQKVYLDTRYVQNIKGLGFVNSEYVISSLRQQLAGANCLLQDSQADADFVVEARVGALGTDGHLLSYGVPGSNVLSSASTVLPNAPPLPAIPEISLARREDQTGAAKIGVFAYHRETKQPVWQSGISEARSTADAMWLFGVGPFQRGTIYDGTKFAGNSLPPLVGHSTDEEPAELADYHEPLVVSQFDESGGEPSALESLPDDVQVLKRAQPASHTAKAANKEPASAKPNPPSEGPSRSEDDP